jgi:iron complex outermembrane recepter protein
VLCYNILFLLLLTIQKLEIMQKIISLFFLGTMTALAADQVEELAPMDVKALSLTANSSNSAKPVTILKGDALQTKMGTTIGDTLKNELGITSQSFGAGVGSPVIRGQAGPRVQVLQNSLGNNDASSLSPDHANGVDPILAERIEVLRGPSTLLYGNGAIGGIVNVLDNRIPEQAFDKVIGGAGQQRYDSATNETSSAIKLEGSHQGFAYHVDGFYRDQGNTHIGGYPIDEAAVQQNDPNYVAESNPKGVIENSAARSRGGSVGASFIADAGLIGASINQLEKQYGIPSDGMDEPPVTVDLRQTKYDFKAQANKPFDFAEKFKFKFGYTDYQHTELDGGLPATQFLNKTYSSRLELEQKPFGNLSGTIGFQSTNSDFSALDSNGLAVLVPKTQTDSYGLFAVESLKAGNVKYELGVRGEWVTVSPEANQSQVYLPISGSASAVWDINKENQLSFAVTHSQRAPLVQELYYDGVHEATRSYELGNANLGKEFSNNLDLGYRFNADWMSVQANVFHNWVSNYIYQQRAGYLFNSDTEAFEDSCTSSCMPVEISQQAGATFKGFEAQVNFPVMANHYGNLDLSLFGDYTRGTFNKGGDVPRMPPLRYGIQLNYEKSKFSSNVRLTRGEAQTHAGENETSTPSYLLLNLGAQYHLASIANSDIMLFANGKNLLNENIRNSTSYLRNFAPDAGRSAELGIRVSY